MKKISTHSEQELIAAGETFAKTLRGGEVICLSGELGAGKTTFTKGLAAGLGVDEVIKSPTFVILKAYPTKHEMIETLIHVDCYRIKNPAEIETIGLTEYYNDPKTVVVIEWPEKIATLLPQETSTIAISSKSQNSREIVFH